MTASDLLRALAVVTVLGLAAVAVAVAVALATIPRGWPLALFPLAGAAELVTIAWRARRPEFWGPT